MSCLFRPGHNCWRVSKAAHATMLVDCANFYRAIHSSIARAQHSIFIIGWDIDSRIRLLRGEDERKSELPSAAGELLAWKAAKNPDIRIYLLRWDYSIAFMGEREFLAERTWELKTPENVHVWLDGTIPIGGSQHQKIILVDDEIAFTGGMDIALQRWDERAHRPFEPERTDPLGPYEPYHDIQIVVDGPVVRHFADLARTRWRQAAGYEALPVREVPPQRTRSRLWPEGIEPWFRDMNCAIVRTDPRETGGQKPAFEVERMYLDLIERAQRFLFIENQFLTRMAIARALNERLRAAPSLRVLIVSSCNPQGHMEREAMWAARIDFKRILEAGIARERVRIIYPYVVDEAGFEHLIRVHAKIFCVDDAYLTVASSNLSNRSMRLDTECDLVLEAASGRDFEDIAAARNDLIAEHTGRQVAEVAHMVENNCTLDELLAPVPGGPYGVREINDTVFTDQRHLAIARRIADPEEPLLPGSAHIPPALKQRARNPKKHVLFAVAGLALLSLLLYRMLAEFVSSLTPGLIETIVESARGISAPEALVLTCFVFVAGGLVAFPLALLTLATAMIFGPVLGPLYAMCGALLSAALLFWLGHVAGVRWLRRLIGGSIERLDHRLRDSGVLGVTAIRMVPAAPFSFVNLAAGISSVRFTDFMIGSFLGLMPGTVAKALVGDSLVRFFLHPDPMAVIYLTSGIAGWAGLAWVSHRLVMSWHAHGA